MPKIYPIGMLKRCTTGINLMCIGTNQHLNVNVYAKKHSFQFVQKV